MLNGAVCKGWSQFAISLNIWDCPPSPVPGSSTVTPDSCFILSRTPVCAMGQVKCPISTLGTHGQWGGRPMINQDLLPWRVGSPGSTDLRGRFFLGIWPKAWGHSASSLYHNALLGIQPVSLLCLVSFLLFDSNKAVQKISDCRAGSIRCYEVGACWEFGCSFCTLLQTERISRIDRSLLKISRLIRMTHWRDGWV